MSPFALLEASAEGLVYGGLYALLGIGFFLTFGVLRRIDLAYGSTIMLAVYVAAMITSRLGLAWLVAIPLALGLGVLIMAIVERVAFRWVGADGRFSMVATIGIWMAINELVLQHGEGSGQPLANPFGLTVFEIGLVGLRADHVAAFAVSLAAIASLAAFLYRARGGRMLRLAAADPELARLLGVDPQRIRAAGCALAAIVGVTGGFAFATAQMSIDVHFAMWATAKGLIVLALGGITNLPAIVSAGLGLGVLEHVGAELAAPGWRDLFGYGLMLALLIATSRGRHWAGRSNLR
jgi:branched-chain amino acid transport system permease protein